MFLGLPDPNPDPLVRDTDPDSKPDHDFLSLENDVNDVNARNTGNRCVRGISLAYKIIIWCCGCIKFWYGSGSADLFL
jgi:hypothetical protein